MALQRILDMLKTDIPHYVANRFLKTALKHPFEMTKETVCSLINWTSHYRRPSEGIHFQIHGHSDFSDGPALSDIIDKMFGMGITLCSITDHDNSDAFDRIADGSYDLRYDIEANSDRRSLIIKNGDRRLYFLRSIEKNTKDGEIGIHGYNGHITDDETDLETVMTIGKETGGFIVMNHPGLFAKGAIYHGSVGKMVALGADAVEMNGYATFPLNYCVVSAKYISKRHDLPLVAGDDAHILETYGRCLYTVRESAFHFAMGCCGGNAADAFGMILRSGAGRTTFNYCTPRQLFRSLRKEHTHSLK
ncbi:hypothetical protein COV93_05140 [Candidatus Woesearchaeota archaeon CG11_big_fil_rev_8_21_14_0_20_43_8]|nr:MAG: hypothetical protein COV93_05140 [Candidatus Woesearchaeota archaeon CG11_big_fil_rev_8_21_14_0_20_43_8]PIO09037.1 MAG: hypothetical protein COT47_00070 [Candidatus Woesearchaeota archaeon CG08_land_8_20_14_0_20_43_7]